MLTQIRIKLEIMGETTSYDVGAHVDPPEPQTWHDPGSPGCFEVVGIRRTGTSKWTPVARLTDEEVEAVEEAASDACAALHDQAAEYRAELAAEMAAERAEHQERFRC